MRFSWANHSERRILVSNVSVTFNGFCEFYTSDWFPYVWALPLNRWRLRRLQILTYATQLSCTFQHSHCTFVTILFGPFARLFFNLAMRIRALCTEWIGASSFEVILAGPSRHSTAGTSSPGTSGSRCFSLILPHDRTWRRIRLCRFCTFIDIVTETAIVSFRTLPVGFSIANNLLESFVHAVLSPDAWPRRSFHNFRFWPRNSWFVDSARYFFSPLSSICD